MGNVQAAKRAQQVNPCGSDGALTKAMEHVPIYSNIIEHLHLRAGQIEAAERARSANLGRALTAVVEERMKALTSDRFEPASGATSSHGLQRMDSQVTVQAAVRHNLEPASEPPE